jgi:hypothetical protein
MRREIVPVDLVSEQKVIMGYASIRQLIYVTVCGILAYQLIGLFNVTALPIVIAVIACIFIAGPFALIVFFFGFWKLEKHDMYLDKYLFIKFRYQQSKNENVFRYGDYIPEWRKTDK